VAVSYLPVEGCCGALDYHLGAHDAGRARMRDMIDRLLPQLVSIDAIVSTASGCGVTIKDYPHALADDAVYHPRALEVCAKVIDASEWLLNYEFTCEPRRVAFHAPCSLQHGQKLNGVVEGVLERAGFELVPVPDAHLCCGSVGTYSMMQPTIANELKQRKLMALQTNKPSIVATANIGCQVHLGGDASVPVVHWLELMADNLRLSEDPPQ
ncbi:MAG: heterodisulfide reductase-related iron-sulfur binding cluster, partial [Proteobacteria bacterium]|nr:heterodisulfide reductase-related iron-sulfur binding cluster [Pseudomonadota bacterium]